MRHRDYRCVCDGQMRRRTSKSNTKLENMKRTIIKITTTTALLLLSHTGIAADLGTRQRTITPVAIPTSPPIMASDLPAYATYGYSSWSWGPPSDMGQLLATMPEGYPGATNSARLLTFFCFSDIHITDKESPSQSIVASYQSETGDFGNSSCYSPTMLRTTQVLDAAVRTANGLHRLMPFDFGMSLGDDCNTSQYNELRWFLDVMDGKHITPSSGTNAGAATIDYQMPYQAGGLNPAIPWYQVLGNHDHYWTGSLLIDDYLRQSYTNHVVLLLGSKADGGAAARSEFMGVIDGSTPYGNVINAGPVGDFIVNGVTNAPTIAADPNRYSLTRSNWVREFFNTTSKPVGHGFSQDNVANDFACYSFIPKADLSLKVLVLDDTMTEELYDAKGQGGLNASQLAWLLNELAQGQASNQLMIVTAHIPIELIGIPGSTNSVISGANLMAQLHNYPNLILWVAGHMHRNYIKAQPSPDANHPEYGFWEVENPSLKDFPQEFRTYEILRNSDNSISMRVTDIDPEAPTNSQAFISRGYAVGASRVFGVPSTNLTDTASYTENAELVKQLTPTMQAVIAGVGEPLGHRLAIDQAGDGATINFLGNLLAADTLNGPWNYVTNISPYSVSAANAARFYRATE
jgi:metallophosphoesterase (TIGR03768 family)